MNPSSIDLDAAATTPVLPDVWDAMRPHFGAGGNPSSSHHVGRRARRALEDARELTAVLLGADPDEVLFTSGATEANNLAVFGLVDAPALIACSPIEHPCVLEPVRQLAARGCEVQWLPVDPDGCIAKDGLPFRADTRLVALMLANHETGAIQPVRAIADRKPPGIPLHCDAAAAAGKLAIDFHALGAATLTVSAHKFHGPPGVGALLLRRGTRLRPLLFGGHQQRGKRPGTESVALAVGLATALRLASVERETRNERVRQLRGSFLDVIRGGGFPVAVNGSEDGLPHVLNLSFPGCRAEMLLMNFDLAGIGCSTGSACSSGSLLPSPVLRTMQVGEERLLSAMRFSFCHLLTVESAREAARRIVEVVRRRG